VLAACLGAARVDSSWNRDQFYFWQYLQMVGQPMIAVSLLMLATNTVKGPEEGPFVSALINGIRGLADPAGTWLVELVTRWRGGLHSDRLVDQVGQNWFRITQPQRVEPRAPVWLLPNDHPGAAHSLQQFAHMIAQQAAVMTYADTFLIMAALCVALILVTLVLPVHTDPPRIVFARR